MIFERMSKRLALIIEVAIGVAIGVAKEVAPQVAADFIQRYGPISRFLRRHLRAILCWFFILLALEAVIFTIYVLIVAPFELQNNGAMFDARLRRTLQVRFDDIWAGGFWALPASPKLELIAQGLMVAINILLAFGTFFSLLYSASAKPESRMRVAVLLSLAAVTYLVSIDVFACIYLVLAYHGGTFHLEEGQQMDAVTALYFSLTTMATVGFGDIYPLTRLAKLCVMAEIVTALVFNVFVFSVLASYIRRAPPSYSKAE